MQKIDYRLIEHLQFILQKYSFYQMLTVFGMALNQIVSAQRIGQKKDLDHSLKNEVDQIK